MSSIIIMTVIQNDSIFVTSFCPLSDQDGLPFPLYLDLIWRILIVLSLLLTLIRGTRLRWIIIRYINSPESKVRLHRKSQNRAYNWRGAVLHKCPLLYFSFSVRHTNRNVPYQRTFFNMKQADIFLWDPCSSPIKNCSFLALAMINLKAGPINYLFMLDQLTGVFLAYTIITRIIFITYPWPISTILGDTFCSFSNYVSFIYLAGSSVWSCFLAVFRIIFIRCQKW